MKLKLILLFILTAFLNVAAQNITLENYIKKGISGNLALKHKTFSLNKSLAALNEARGMFMPSITISARYSRAGGGRTFDVPVGDLVNPIYTGLNQIIGADVYPTNIANQQINFLREKEHETKISMVQPLFQPAIYYNYKIKENLTDIEKAERNLFIRALVADIKTSYYNYLKTLRVVELFARTEELLKENLRVSKSLFENDKVTEDAVFRAEAELSKLIQEKSEAEKNNRLAKSYFNFLLNNEFNSDIVIIEEDLEIQNSQDIDSAEKEAINNREEIKQLEFSIEAADNTSGLSKSNYFPGVSLAVDYGFQGEEYKFTKDYDFWMASVVLRWNLFNGLSDNAKVEQADWQKEIYKAKKDELINQIKLQVEKSYQNLMVSLQSIKAAEDRLKSAAKSFEIVNKKYSEGLASQIEYLDSRTTLTQAEINLIITKYSYKNNLAEYEKVTAEYPVNEIDY